MTESMISMKIPYDFPTGVTSVADPHRKNADADPGKISMRMRIRMRIRCGFMPLLNYGEPSNSIKNL